MSKKSILISAIIFGFSLVLFLNISRQNKSTVEAGTSDNISGWAWSENIGWISFNNTSGGGSTSYGVNIDSATGNFSGYAWSENIGWISFTPDGPYPGAPNYSAQLDTASNQVTGWARACAGTVNGDCVSAARTDGWDGWIKMSGTATNGSSYGVTRSGCDLIGYVWGSDVVGWIKFNDSGYKVVTTFCEIGNQAPSATNLSITQPDYCIITWPAAIFSWQFTDPDGDSQSAYQVQVDNNPSFSSVPLPVDSGKVPCTPPPCSYATLPGALSWNTTYYWQLTVWDSKDASSTWIEYNDPTDPDGDGNPKTFTIPSHSYPSPNFFPSPQNPSIGEVVIFTDNSKCYISPGNVEKPCKELANTQYAWDFDYITTEGFTVDSTVKGNATTTYTTAGPKTVRLTITDNSLTPSGSCYIDRQVNTSLPLPIWKEIPPF